MWTSCFLPLCPCSSDSLPQGLATWHLVPPQESQDVMASTMLRQSNHDGPVIGGFLSHRGTPSHHPLLVGICHAKPSILGVPPVWKPMETPNCMIKESIVHIRLTYSALTSHQANFANDIQPNCLTTLKKFGRMVFEFLVASKSCE